MLVMPAVLLRLAREAQGFEGGASVSWRAANAVKMDSESEGTARLFLIMLADWADDYGICWPGIESVASDCRINERTVRRQIDHTEEMGELIVIRRRRATSVYILNLPSLKPLDDIARHKLEEALGEYPEDLDRTICPRTERSLNVQGTKKNLRPTPFKAKDLSSADNSESSRPVKKYPAIAYFKDSQERVPNPREIVRQEQTGEPMVWHEGRWRHVEWAS